MLTESFPPSLKINFPDWLVPEIRACDSSSGEYIQVSVDTKTFDIYADHLFHPERQSFVKYNNNDIVRVGDYSSGDSFTEKTLMLDIVNAIRQHHASPQTPSRMAG